MPAERSVAVKQFTINLTLLDGVAGDVDEVDVRMAVIDGLRRRGLGGAAGFEVTVSEAPLSGAENEPATRERGQPGHATFDTIARAWSVAAKAVIHARIAERREQTGRPVERDESAPGRT